MINFASNLNKMIDAGLGGPLDPPRTEVAVGHRVVYTEVSGDVVNFETNVIAPVKNLRVTMEPIQAGSGDPSPENIRPISGRDAVTVWRCGINYFDGQMENGDISETTGQNSGASSSRRRCVNYIPIPPGTTSLYFYNSGRTTVRIFFYRADKSYMYLNTIDTNRVYTLPAGAQTEARYIRFRYASAAIDSDTSASINIPSTYHDYHAYDGQSATIQLGQTVYGGTVDVTTGTMTVTRGEIASYAGETLPGEWISDRDVYAAGTTPTIGAQVVYELADSFIIDLTPAQLITLKGQNNVWSDAGNISLEYPYYEETEGY